MNGFSDRGSTPLASTNPKPHKAPGIGALWGFVMPGKDFIPMPLSVAGNAETERGGIMRIMVKFSIYIHTLYTNRTTHIQ